MNIAPALLDIDQVNQLTGLPQATLRNWEKRYGFPRPQRSQGGHRLYDVEEVRKIREVVSLHKSGMKVREAIDQVLNERSSVQQEVSPAQSSNTLNYGLTQVLEALYQYDAAMAETNISRLGMRLSETDLLEMVYPRLLKQVGEDWEQSRINVAQEHFSWNFLRTRLLNYFKSGSKGSLQPRIILATPEGELHEGGLLILAAYLMLRGWNVYYLGVNLPIGDLKQASATINPDIVCLSAITSESISKNWVELESFNTAVVIGGSCLMQLRSQPPPISSRISFVEGDLPSAIAQMELLVHSMASKLKLGS